VGLDRPSVEEAELPALGNNSRRGEVTPAAPLGHQNDRRPEWCLPTRSRPVISLTVSCQVLRSTRFNRLDAPGDALAPYLIGLRLDEARQRLLAPLA